MIKKIAVFISGPERYLPFVLDNLSKCLQGHDYIVYTFIWKEGEDNRVTSNKPEQINSYIKESLLFINHEPFNGKYIDDKYGSKVLGHSSKKAMLGMFYSVSTLCHFAEQDPNFVDVSHILRIRTDNVLFNIDFIDQYTEGDIVVSDNPLIPTSWISDHIMFCSKSDFIKIWKFKNIKTINRLFELSSNNPELLLRLRSLFKLCKIKRVIKRYTDYHIVYSKNKNEPDYMQRIMRNNPCDVFINHPNIDERKMFYTLTSKNRIKRESNIKVKLLSGLLGTKIRSILKRVG